MKFLIIGILTMLLITSMFGFVYKNHNLDNKKMYDYQKNNYLMSNKSMYYNMMNNNFGMIGNYKRANHDSMSYMLHGM